MAESVATLRFTVYDKDLVRQGWIGSPLSARVTERWLGLGDAEITVSATDPILEPLLKPGARVVIDYVRDGGGSSVLTGMVRNPRGSFMPGGTVTVQVQDDWRWLRNINAYVVPGGNVKADSLTDMAQSVNPSGAYTPPGTIRNREGRYVWPSTPTVLPAETAVHKFLETHLKFRWREEFGDNGPNFPYRFSGAYDQGRGPDVRGILPQVRFDSLESVVVPLLQAGNLGLRFKQTPGDLHEGIRGANAWEMWEPKVWAHTFTPDSGVLRDGEWSMEYPNTTNVIIGGPGEEAARAFRRYENTHNLKTEYEDLIDGFKDATGAPVYWPETVTDEWKKVPMYYHLMGEIPADRKTAFETFLNTAGAKALTEGAPTSGVSLELAESEGFQYGDGPDRFRTGDILTVAPSAETALTGLTFTDRITSTTITMSRDTGVTVTPQLGQKKDDPDIRLALAIRDLAATNRTRSINQ